MSQPVYEIEKILDEAIIDEKPHYLIKWKGYSSVQSTWEPIENLIDALQIVHKWKLVNSSHTPRRQIISKQKQLGKTKKIQSKEHPQREIQLQSRLNAKNKVAKKCIPCSTEESFSSQYEFEKQFETSEFSFGQKNHQPMKSKPKNFERETTKLEGSCATKSQRRSSHSRQNKDESELTGFKVVGRVTKQVIQTVLWCFDWEDEKVCQVQLKDGRKVNMKREDVKKICPEKLLEYYEKLERVRL